MSARRASADGPAIRAEGLVRRFGDNAAVDGVDLEVAPGEIYGFLGPNGAGKTTTVRMLVTLLAPTAGRAWVAGRDVLSDPGGVRLRIGVALQEAALDPMQTGAEILRLQGRLYGLTGPEIENRLEDLRGLIDIGDALDRFVGSYSGGMRRRLDLASALVHNPEVLFSGFWGLAFTGFPYTIALRTGNPAAVNSSFILFFPFAFLTTTFLPQEALTGWLATVADYNPVTYLLAGLRALITDGWVAADLLTAVGAVAAVAFVTFGLAFGALRARVRRA
jgi:ABC-type ATPase involved in cell division